MPFTGVRLRFLDTRKRVPIEETGLVLFDFPVTLMILTGRFLDVLRQLDQKRAGPLRLHP